MLLKIQWTSTVFAKPDMKQHKNTCFQAASGFLETNREVPAFFFQNCRRFLLFKTPTPGQRENLRGRPGGGWSGLELTETLSEGSV